jgi:hypothetical protein
MQVAASRFSYHIFLTITAFRKIYLKIYLKIKFISII